MSKKKFALLSALSGIALLIVLATLSNFIAYAQRQGLEARKEHGKLYSDYVGPEKLSTLAAKKSGDIEVSSTQIPPKPFAVPNACVDSPYPSRFLREIMNAADAVVIGTLTDKASSMTEDETFIFTDYKMSVEEVIKSPSQNPISINSSIIVTRPGGTLTINGHTVRAKEDHFKNFEDGGKYLLFLKFIPSTGAYRAYKNGSFLLSNGKMIPLTDENLSSISQVSRDENTFIEEVRAATLSPCGTLSLY